MLTTTTTDKPEDVEVRLADQEKINEFGRLNNRLLDIRAEVKQAKADHEKLKVIYFINNIIYDLTLILLILLIGCIIWIRVSYWW